MALPLRISVGTSEMAKMETGVKVIPMAKMVERVKVPGSTLNLAPVRS